MIPSKYILGLPNGSVIDVVICVYVYGHPV